VSPRTGLDEFLPIQQAVNITITAVSRVRALPQQRLGGAVDIHGDRL
jgi:hypothetical protein